MRPITGEMASGAIICIYYHNSKLKMRKVSVPSTVSRSMTSSTTPVSIHHYTIAGATQVKWNRHNENILASSHGSILLIWDQRVRYFIYV